MDEPMRQSFFITLKQERSQAMAEREITFARIYLREAEHLLNPLIRFLHDEQKISGVTVLRGVAGFSQDGKIHSASLVELSLDLPLVVEFFDEPARVQAVLAELLERLPLAHVVTWPGTAHRHE
jgi:hypothetical protein